MTGTARAVMSPLSVAMGNKRGTWKPVHVEETIVVKGGFNTRPETAPIIRYQTSPTTVCRFVELDKNATWFLKGVGGAKTVKGDLKPVQVLQEIRQQFNIACGEDQPHTTAAAVAGIEDDSQDSEQAGDPMDDLGDIVVALPTAKSKPKPKAEAKRLPKRASVQQFAMPMRPNCTGYAQDDTINISVYRKPSEYRNKAKLFLREDFIHWLLSYAADELHFQGVVCVREEPERELVM